MRVFVTGASGFIGTAIVRELLDAGHEVLGLARSDAAAQTIAAAGAGVHRGDLEDLESLRAGADQSDGVIHTGFVHDFSRFKEVCEIDRRAIEALGSALAGSDRLLIVTSGTALLAQQGRLATEEDAQPADSALPRMSEVAGAAATAQGAKVAVVRLPPSVHGVGDHGFVPILIGLAREKGVAAYVGDGLNRWPAVHRLDAGHLYRLALENGAAGVNYHGVGEEGVLFKDIAAEIGRGLNVPAASMTPEEAAAHFTWFAYFASIDNPTSSAVTRESLGWNPEGPDLLTDIRDNGYF
jgi:nucleoside-diphosphate-sugar epimerase